MWVVVLHGTEMVMALEFSECDISTLLIIAM